ncbi:MAG TPA: glycine zipper domain-containing protein [Candidatus Binataceae bacterium]|nr:glycine zipper domain-containing protein [Candidatus Binataceae bacterium]
MKASYLSILTVFAAIGLAAANGNAQGLTTTEEGVIGGAALGAGTGAIIGAGVHHAGRGALIGAGIGAVTGGVAGHVVENQQNTNRQLQSEVSAQQRQIDHQRAEIEELKQGEPATEAGQRMNPNIEEETE